MAKINEEMGKHGHDKEVKLLYTKLEKNMPCPYSTNVKHGQQITEENN